MKKTARFKSLISIICIAAVTAAVVVPLFTTTAESGIYYDPARPVRVRVGPYDVVSASFRSGDIGTNYADDDPMNPSERYFELYSYDNVTKEETLLFTTEKGAFALAAVVDENYYYSSDWYNDYGGWIDTASHGSFSVKAGNRHVEIDRDFAALDDAAEIMALLRSLGYYVFPAYVNGVYRIRINSYTSVSDASKAAPDVSKAYNDEASIINEETASSAAQSETSSEPSSEVSSEPETSSDVSSSESDVSEPSESSSDVTESSEVSSDSTSSEEESSVPEDSSESTSSDETSDETSSEPESNVSSDVTSEPNENDTSVPEIPDEENSSFVEPEPEPDPMPAPYYYPELTFIASPESANCMTVVDERSGAIYFEFDVAEKWLRVKAYPYDAIYHRIYSMTASASNRNLGRTYRGMLDIARVPDNDGKLLTVNAVDMDAYLKGVLMREMGNTSNESLYEAYRTQAIVARTYALRKILVENVHGKNNVFGYDICDGSHCQAYWGNSDMATSIVSNAVDTTTKMVITYKTSKGNDALIEAVYSASNGGYSMSNNQYWGTTQTSYLKQVEDPYEDLDHARFGRWSTSFTPEALGEYLNFLRVNEPSYYRLLRIYTSEGFITGSEYSNATRLSQPVGKIVRFYAEVTTPLGDIPLKLVFDDENGIKVYIQYGSNIKSFMSARSNIGIKGFESAVLKSPDFHIGYALEGFYALGIDGTVTFENDLVKTYVLTADGVTELNKYPDELKILSSKSSYFPNPDQYRYLINGTGWGHTVGLSQEGAFGRSKAGFTAEEIITHYYTGVTIMEIEAENPT